MRAEVTQKTLSKLIQISLFKSPPEKILKVGRLVNVFTGEILKKVYVGIWKQWIAYVVGWDHPLTKRERTEIIDLSAYTLCPGFIDGHTHVDSLTCLGEFLKYAIPRGATTIITETSAITSALGEKGVKAFLKDAAHQPIPVFITAPPEIPPYPKFETCAPFDLSDFESVLNQDQTLGLGEIYWGNLIDRNPELLERVAMTLKQGKVVEGHAAELQAEGLLGGPGLFRA